MSDDPIPAPPAPCGQIASDSGALPGVDALGAASLADALAGAEAPDAALAGESSLAAAEHSPADLAGDSSVASSPLHHFSLSATLTLEGSLPQGSPADSDPMPGCLIPSASNSGSLGKHVAAENIGGGRFVYFGNDWKIRKADGPAGLPAHAFIKQAIVEGAEVEVFKDVPLNGLSGLTPGQYWLGAGGNPTKTFPLTGCVQPVGQATSATTLAVDLEEPTFYT